MTPIEIEVYVHWCGMLKGIEEDGHMMYRIFAGILC